jgi:putative sterol carrier protein
MPTAEDLITQMQAKAGSLKRLGYRVRFDLTDTEESILVDGTAGAAEITEATSADAADTVLMLTADNLAKLIAGKLSPMLAFATGKLKVEGSKGVAMKMASLLDED